MSSGTRLLGIVLILMVGVLNFHAPHFVIEPARSAPAETNPVIELLFLANLVGAVVAIVGAALGLWLFGGTATVIVWLAIAGAFGGAIVGPPYGIARMSRYDDDAARTTQLEPGMDAVVVRALTPRTGASCSAREIMRRAGAVALLDVPAYEASLRTAAEPALVMASTSTGNAAAPAAVPPFGRQPLRGTDDQN